MSEESIGLGYELEMVQLEPFNFSYPSENGVNLFEDGRVNRKQHSIIESDSLSQANQLLIVLVKDQPSLSFLFDLVRIVYSLQICDKAVLMVGNVH